MDDHFHAAVFWLGGEHEALLRPCQGKNMRDHVLHVHPLVLDPSQRGLKVPEIRSVGMRDGDFLLPQVPQAAKLADPTQ